MTFPMFANRTSRATRVGELGRVSQSGTAPAGSPGPPAGRQGCPDVFMLSTQRPYLGSPGGRAGPAASRAIPVVQSSVTTCSSTANFQLSPSMLA